MLEYLPSGGIDASKCPPRRPFRPRLTPMPPWRTLGSPIFPGAPHRAFFPRGSMTCGPRACSGPPFCGVFIASACAVARVGPHAPGEAGSACQRCSFPAGHLSCDGAGSAEVVAFRVPFCVGQSGRRRGLFGCLPALGQIMSGAPRAMLPGRRRFVAFRV